MIHTYDLIKRLCSSRLILKSKLRVSTIMKFFVVQTIAVTVFLLTNCMVPANGGQSLADLHQSLIQDEGSAQFMQTAIVESIAGRAQSFSLNIVGCDTISSTVRSKLSNYLEEVFPGKGITISCAAGKIL